MKVRKLHLICGNINEFEIMKLSQACTATETFVSSFKAFSKHKMHAKTLVNAVISESSPPTTPPTPANARGWASTPSMNVAGVVDASPKNENASYDQASL